MLYIILNFQIFQLSGENGESLHFWYNTTALETASKKVWGNKVGHAISLSLFHECASSIAPLGGCLLTAIYIYFYRSPSLLSLR